MNIKQNILRGLLLVLPVGIGITIIYKIYRWIEGGFRLLVWDRIGFYVPFLGILTLLVLAYIIGWLLRKEIKKKSLWERFEKQILKKIPFVKWIWSLVEQFRRTTKDKQLEKLGGRVVLIKTKDLFQVDCWIPTAVSNIITVKYQEKEIRFVNLVDFFAPWPSGPQFWIKESEFLNSEDIILTDMTIQQYLAYTTSFGTSCPIINIEELPEPLKEILFKKDN